MINDKWCSLCWLTPVHGILSWVSADDLHPLLLRMYQCKSDNAFEYSYKSNKKQLKQAARTSTTTRASCHIQKCPSGLQRTEGDWNRMSVNKIITRTKNETHEKFNEDIDVPLRGCWKPHKRLWQSSCAGDYQAIGKRHWKEAMCL